MRVKGHSSHLFFIAVCASVESSEKKKNLGDKQGLSGGGLAAVSRPKSGTVAWKIIWAAGTGKEEGVCLLQTGGRICTKGERTMLLLSASGEVPSLASVSSVFSSCCSRCPAHPPQSDGQGSLNSNNPAQHQSIFYFIKEAGALLLGCNDSTDLRPIGWVSQAFGDVIKENTWDVPEMYVNY